MWAKVHETKTRHIDWDSHTSNDLMLSLLHFSSVCKSLSVMIEPEIDRKCASPMIATPDKGERNDVRDEKRIPTMKYGIFYQKKTIISYSHMCSKMLVSSWCVAATLTEQGSAGLTPTSVVNIRLSSSITSFESPKQDLTCFPTCVSNSDVTTKSEEVNDCIKFEQASGAKVPPLWLLTLQKC